MVKRVLNVAEKPDAAKKIAHILANGQPQSRAGRSVYNRIYEFGYRLNNENVTMVVTSVTGHMQELEFQEPFNNWSMCDPAVLFDLNTPVAKSVGKDKEPIAETLRAEARNCDILILWLDCDREGENISFEVITTCQESNRNLKIPTGTIKRARFSEFTPRAIIHAVNHLVPPNERDSLAVDARQEIDLRIGAAFTRFQTRKLREKFTGLPKNPISYGPCQFPTLGFVVQRFLRIQNFIPENFWTIFCSHEKNKAHCEFVWKRGRLFDRLACLVLYELCVESGEAVVTTIQKRERRKWKPLPLNTVELQKIASRKLRLGAQDTMHRAEALYNQGFISYPRTETNKFTLTDDELKALANEHIGDNNYGNFAQEVVNGNMYGRPRAGTSDDKAHPPIHPIKAPPANMDRTDQQLYEIITRHFLASISRDAVGHETAITINIAGEEFTTKGLMISEENYLEVYIYDKWTDKNIPVFQEGERFRPTTLLMKESKTQAPPLLSESDLISLMDKNQIGTDATIATHIETIQKREYAIKRNNVFEPTDLGLALVQGYTSMGLDGLAKPNLRAKMEADMNSISRGNVSKDQVLQQNLDMYKNVFVEVTKKVHFMYQSFNLKFKSIGQQGGQPTEVIQRNLTECGNCQNMMDLKKQDERMRFLYCRTCQESHIVPPTGDLSAHDHRCPLCNFQILSVLNTQTQKTHTVCPRCFKHPPADIEDADKFNGFRCFQCTAACPMASGRKKEDTVASNCDVCRSNPMVLKTTKEKKFYVGCKGYPGCKHAIWFPSSTKEATVTTRVCGGCRNRGRVFLIQASFDPTQIPPSSPEHITGCVFCDGPLSQMVSRRGNDVAPQAPVRDNNQQRLQYGRQPQQPPQRPQQRQNNSPPHRNQDVLGKRPRPGPVNGGNNTDAPHCNCGLPCRMFTCKQGDNAGRQFWKCATQDPQCQHVFIWEDSR